MADDKKNEFGEGITTVRTDNESGVWVGGGGEVVLTVNDRPFSLLHLDKKSEAYVEEEIECVVLKKKKPARKHT